MNIRYELYQKGFRGGIGADFENTYGIKLVIGSHSFTSNKTYKNYYGAELAAKKLIKQLKENE